MLYCIPAKDGRCLSATPAETDTASPVRNPTLARHGPNGSIARPADDHGLQFPTNRLSDPKRFDCASLEYASSRSRLEHIFHLYPFRPGTSQPLHSIAA